MITNREVEIRAYVEAYNDRVGDASLEYLRLALDLLDEARIEIQKRHEVIEQQGLSMANMSRELREKDAEIAQPLPALPELRPEDFLRCLVTKNKCGTDTWAVGQPCQCENCQRWLRLRASPEADVMERAGKVWQEISTKVLTGYSTAYRLVDILIPIRRALTEYGDQRAREAEAGATAQFTQWAKAYYDLGARAGTPPQSSLPQPSNDPLKPR